MTDQKMVFFRNIMFAVHITALFLVWYHYVEYICYFYDPTRTSFFMNYGLWWLNVPILCLLEYLMSQGALFIHTFIYIVFILIFNFTRMWHAQRHMKQFFKFWPYSDQAIDLKWQNVICIWLNIQSTAYFKKPALIWQPEIMKPPLATISVI